MALEEDCEGEGKERNPSQEEKRLTPYGTVHFPFRNRPLFGGRFSLCWRALAPRGSLTSWISSDLHYECH